MYKVKIRDNKGIIEEYELFKKETQEKFNFKIENMIDYACKYNNIEFIKDNIDYYSENAINIASKNCNTEILEIIKKENFIYTEDALDKIKIKDEEMYKKTITWWIESNNELKYTYKLFYKLCKKDKIELLEWLFKTGLDIKQSKYIIDYIHNPDILKIWFNLNIELEYTEKALEKAAHRNNKEIIKAWLESKYELKYTEKVLDNICQNCNIELIEIWLTNGLEIKYSYIAFIPSCIAFNTKVDYEQEYINMLNKIKEYKIEIIMDEAILKWVCYNKWENALEWYFNSNIKLKYDETILNYAFMYKHENIIRLWERSGLELKYDKDIAYNYYNDIEQNEMEY